MQLDIRLHVVEASAYPSIRIVDMLRPYWIFSFVREGRVITYTRYGKEAVGNGELMIHPPYLPFTEIAKTPGLHEWIMFEFKIRGEASAVRLHDLPLRLPLSDGPGYSEKFRQLAAWWERPATPSRETQLIGVLLQMIGQAVQDWETAGEPRGQLAGVESPARFQELIAYLNANLSKRVTREELAKQLHLHPGYLDRAFAAVYGMPPMMMLRKLRLQRAAQMLETTSDTLSVIAEACGLGDAPYLSRAFLKATGMTPIGYRRAAGKEDGYYRIL